MEPRRIWIDQCDAAEGIENDFGTQQALNYLISEKFLDFLDAAETDAAFRAEIPGNDRRNRAHLASKKIVEIGPTWQCHYLNCRISRQKVGSKDVKGGKLRKDTTGSS